MSARRALLIGCALALLGAASVWLVMRSRVASESRPSAQGEPAPGAASERVEVAAPGDDGAATQPIAEERDVALAALDAGRVDDVTLEELRAANLDLAPKTVVVGRVVDDAGKPVRAVVFASTKRAHAAVMLDAPANRARVKLAESDADGRFELTGLDLGPLRLAVRAEGFAPLDPPELALPAGPRFDAGDLRLARGVVLAGRVLDPDLRPVPHAAISLVSAPLSGPVHRLGSFAESPLGESDDFGRFTLACVAAGRSTLRVEHPEFPAAAFDVDCAADRERRDDLELVLPRAALVDGSILDYDARLMPELSVVATPVDGLQLFQESRPENASSAWLSGIQRERVDPYGRFTLRGLDPGRTYALRARRDGAPPSAADEELEDRWAPATIAQAGARDVEVCYRPGARIEFAVTDRASGEPIERLSVRLTGALPFQPLDEQGKPRTVFPGGSVSLLDVRALGLAAAYEPGAERREQAEVSLAIESPGYDTCLLDGLRLEPGLELGLGVVRLDALPVLEVRAIDAATGKPLAGARVELTADRPALVPGRRSSVATTQRGGVARLTGLRTLEATLRVTCPGYSPAKLPAPVYMGAGARPTDVALVRGARLIATVRDAHGSVAAAEVVCTAAEWSSALRTDARGVAVFEDVPEGPCEVFVASRPSFQGESAAGEHLATQRLFARSGEELALELDIEALSSLSGVLWIGPRPLADATLSFSANRWAFRDIGTDLQQFGRAARARTDARGEFAGLALWPGEYVVLIEQAELGVRTRRVVRVERAPTSVILDVDDTQVTGRVVDSHGQPLEGAAVCLYADRPGPRKDIRPSLGEFLLPAEDGRRRIAEATTDANGDYRLRCVPPGVPLEVFFCLGRRAASIPRINVPQGVGLSEINARLPDGGSLEIVLAAPLAPPGRHYGVRVAALKQLEGLAVDGADFDRNNRARFDELPAGDWVVMVFELDAAELVVDRRAAQTVKVKPGETTEFSVGW